MTELKKVKPSTESDNISITKSFHKQTHYKTKTMTTTPLDNNPGLKIGFTLVWEGKPTTFVTVIRQWSSVPSDLLIVESSPNPSNIGLWVANEWIDWQHLRVLGKFRPANIKRSGSKWIKSHIANEIEPHSPVTGLTYAEEESQSCWGDSGMEGRI